jgi:uncharacterized membrane protein
MLHAGAMRRDPAVVDPTSHDRRAVGPRQLSVAHTTISFSHELEAHFRCRKCPVRRIDTLGCRTRHSEEPRVSLIPADDSTALGAVIFGLAWLGFWADRNRYTRKFSGVPWVLTVGLLLSNFGVIPHEAPAFGFVGQYLLPLGVPFLLFKANLRNVFTDGRWVLPTFLVAAVGVVVGAVSGYFLFDLGEAGAKIAGTYAGAFIGGVVNFVAISQAVEMTPTEFSVSLGASAPAAIVGLLILVTLPSSPFVRRLIPSKIIDVAEQPGGDAAADELPRFRLEHIAGAIAISFAICAVSEHVSRALDLGTYKLFVITILTVVLANLFPRQFARLEGDFVLGMLCMYAFFAMIGAGTDARGFITAAPILFVYCVFMLVVHFVVWLVIARFVKFDLAEWIIGSGAAIVGPAASAGIASAKGWKTLITPAITIGMFGYVIANFVGIAIYRWLS